MSYLGMHAYSGYFSLRCPLKIVFSTAVVHTQCSTLLCSCLHAAVRYTRIHNSTRVSPYTVRVKGIRYGGRDILFFGDGGDKFIEGSFDTGSDCVMLPDSQFGALEASPFR